MKQDHSVSIVTKSPLNALNRYGLLRKEAPCLVETTEPDWEYRNKPRGARGF